MTTLRDLTDDRAVEIIRLLRTIRAVIIALAVMVTALTVLGIANRSVIVESRDQIKTFNTGNLSYLANHARTQRIECAIWSAVSARPLPKDCHGR